MSIIRTENLSRNYQQGSVTVHALQDVNLEIQRGDFAVLLISGIILLISTIEESAAERLILFVK